MNGFAYRIDKDVEKIEIDAAPGATGTLVWVHLNTNGVETQRWLAERGGLDPYVVDALTATETRPRCDQFDDGAIINLRGRGTQDMTTSDLLASVRMWASAGRVTSVSRMPLMAVDEVREEIEKGTIRDPGDLIAAIARRITEDLDPEVADLGDLLDDCEADLDQDRIFELRRTVTRVRVRAIGYRRFLAPQRAALEKLSALPAAWLQDDDRLQLAAAADRAARMAEELESIRERAALTHEALTDLRAEQIDSRALIISVVAMVFLPLTFLTGLLGMNVKGIPYADAPWAFDGVTALCALVALVISLYFVRQHWFK